MALTIFVTIFRLSKPLFVYFQVQSFCFNIVLKLNDKRVNKRAYVTNY